MRRFHVTIVAVEKQCVTYPSSGSRDVPFGQKDERTYLRADMTQMVVALREFCKRASNFV